jgi:5-amino-6-(5-phospho-D-ribitylamino)uracil phosphatase
MTQILAVDLDDTLLRSDKSLAPITLELLLEWRSRGNRIVIATGRPPRSVGEALPDELWDVPWICYNGAEIRISGASAYQDLLTPADTREIIDIILCALPDATLGLEIEDVLYLNRHWARPSPYEVVDLLTVANRAAAKILFFHEDIDNLDGVFTGLPGSAQVMVSTKYRLVQVMSHSADKANALRHLVSTWDMDMGSVIAFGDDINDVGMVRDSGVGVAVENAVPEVKAVADRITLSNDDGGVDLVLQEFLDR